MKWLFWIFAALYTAAIFYFLTGTFGWFGQELDPMAGAFLIPLGMPWNLLAGKLGLAGVTAGLLSPAINLGILYLLWR